MKRHLSPAQIAKLICEEDSELGALPPEDNEPVSVDLYSSVNTLLHNVSVLHLNGNVYSGELALSNGTTLWLGNGSMTKEVLKSGPRRGGWWANTSGKLKQLSQNPMYRVSAPYNYAYSIKNQERQPMYSVKETEAIFDRYRAIKDLAELLFGDPSEIAQMIKHYHDQTISDVIEYIGGSKGWYSQVFADEWMSSSRRPKSMHNEFINIKIKDLTQETPRTYKAFGDLSEAQIVYLANKFYNKSMDIIHGEHSTRFENLISMENKIKEMILYRLQNSGSVMHYIATKSGLTKNKSGQPVWAESGYGSAISRENRHAAWSIVRKFKSDFYPMSLRLRFGQAVKVSGPEKVITINLENIQQATMQH